MKTFKMFVVIVCGLPGSGKSYLASRLASKTGADYFKSDEIRKLVFKNKHYSIRDKNVVYELMLKKIEESLKLQRNVVVDGTFYKKEIRDLYLGRLQLSNAKIFLIEIKAPIDIIRKRLSYSRADSDADFKVYRIVESEFDKIEEPHLVLESTDSNVEKLIYKAIEYISKGHGKTAD